MNNKTLSCALLLSFVCSAGEVMAAKVFTQDQVKGKYSISFEGEIINGPFADLFGVGPIGSVGVIDIHWDGRQNKETGMFVDAEGTRTISANGDYFRNAFECDLTLNPDGMGDATCVIVPDPGLGLPDESFDFVLEDNGRSFRYIGTTEGLSVFGSGRKQ